MATPAELEARIKQFDWNDLRKLWAAIQAGNTPGWEGGEGVEYLVLRAFELDPTEKVVVRYPYEVSLFGEKVEEIDGAVHLSGLSCLVESKDWGKNVAIAPIVKMRSQLLRRPAGTIGLLFAKKDFTKPAIYLTHFTLPQAILLWPGSDLQIALEEGRICESAAEASRLLRGRNPRQRPSRKGRAMKRAYVLVEGQTDADFLRRILPPEVTQDVEFFPAGDSGGIPSLARTLVVRRRVPVAVFMDAESLDPGVIEERRGGTEELIRAAAASIPVKVVVAVPEIEAWFFAAPEAIERVLGTKVPVDWLRLGKRDPSGVLDLLATRANRKWDPNQAIRALDAHDVDRIRAIPAVNELSQFLQDVPRDGRAA